MAPLSCSDERLAVTAAKRVAAVGGSQAAQQFKTCVIQLRTAKKDTDREAARRALLALCPLGLGDDGWPV